MIIIIKPPQFRNMVKFSLEKAGFKFNGGSYGIDEADLDMTPPNDLPICECDPQIVKVNVPIISS